MRKQSLVFVTLALFVACAETTDPANPVDGDAGATAEGGKSDARDGDGSTVIPGDDAAASDASTNDGSTSDASATDAASDAPADVSQSDAVADTSTDAPADVAADAPIDTGADSGCPGAIVNPTCVPAANNFAFCGVATATSEYSAFYDATKVNDGLVSSSWYAGSGACPGNTCPGTDIRVDVELNRPRTVGRIKIFGNRDFATDYDLLTARLQLLDANGAVLYTTDVTTPRGAEPNGDVDHVVPGGRACVKKLRVIALTGEAPGLGFAEVEAFAN